MRDALSLLDQCISFHLGEKLTYENVLDVLGAVDTEVFSRLLRAIINKDAKSGIEILNELVDDGRELGQLVVDFTWYLRNLMLIQSSDDMEDVLDMSADNISVLKEEAGLIEPEQLIRYIRIFSELSNQIKYATQKRILIEIAIIKLCRPQMEQDYDSLVDRIATLEKKMEEGVKVVAAPAAVNGAAVKEPPVKRELPKAIPEDIQEVIKNWKSILSSVGGTTRVYLSKAVPTLSAAGGLELVFDDANAYEYLNGNRADSVTGLKNMIENKIGKEIEILIHKNESGYSAEETVPDLRQLIQFDIVEENFDEE